MGIGEESEPLSGNGSPGLLSLISSWPDLVTSDTSVPFSHRRRRHPNGIVKTNLLEGGRVVETACETKEDPTGAFALPRFPASAGWPAVQTAATSQFQIWVSQHCEFVLVFWVDRVCSRQLAYDRPQ